MPLGRADQIGKFTAWDGIVADIGAEELYCQSREVRLCVFRHVDILLLRKALVFGKQPLMRAVTERILIVIKQSNRLR